MGVVFVWFMAEMGIKLVLIKEFILVQNTD